MRPLLPIAITIMGVATAFAQVPAGGEIQVNIYTTDGQTHSGVALEPDGDFVVVWHSQGQDGSGRGVFGRRFEASGVPRGGEFQVNVTTTGDQGHTSIAIDRRGGFVVVWQGTRSGGPVSDIVGRRFDTSGTPLGSEFIVNSHTTGHHSEPSVSMAPDGRFVVAWMADGTYGGVVARRFDRHGDPVGTQFVVASVACCGARPQSVAVGPDGAFVVAWHADPPPMVRIYAQRYDAGGNQLGSQFQVNTYTGRSQFPSVDVSPTGGFVVAWCGETPSDGSFWGVSARRYDAGGNAIGAEFLVNTFTPGYQLVDTARAIAHDEAGNFVVTWSGFDGAGIDSFGQRFDAAGGRRGLEFRINTFTTANQAIVSVASDPVGNFVTTWYSMGQDGSDTGVYARRFGGLFPAALAVDPAGNGVLEPGESVAVRPAWRNLHGSAQTFSATLSAIAGPAGAVYAITDGAGDYGAVADGALGPCVDCYGVSVSAPPSRPAVHWDASAIESVVPDAHGQQKRWLLHLGDSFGDVPRSSAFYPFVETLLHQGVTGGCAASSYCPSLSASREQMAVFVLVAKDGAGNVPPACTTPMFADVPASSPFCPWIEELARRGVVSGCGGGNYCPDTPASREQMAVFVLRTKEPGLVPPPCGAPLFDDVPASSPFCPWIEELARRGVVAGCGGGNYCPTEAVTREPMAAFVAAGFELQLYGP